jgi:hypothetical protein
MKGKDLKENFINKGIYSPNYSFSITKWTKYEPTAITSEMKSKYGRKQVKIEKSKLSH